MSLRCHWSTVGGAMPSLLSRMNLAVGREMSNREREAENEPDAVDMSR